MKFLALAFAFLLLALPARADDTEHFNRSLKLPAGGTLRLRGFAGHVTITASDGDEVSVDAVRHGSRAWLDRTKLEMYAQGSTVVVRDDESVHTSWFDWSPHHSIGETDFDIKVPKHINLDVNVFSSPVDVRGVEGTHKIHTFSAKIHLEDAVGSIDAHTFSGGVDIQTKAWQDRQAIDVHTFSGSVELRIPESARGSVSFNSFSGRMTSDVPLTLHTSSRRSLDATLGGGDSSNGHVQVKTFSGNVHINK